MLVALTALLSIFQLTCGENSTESTVVAANIYDDAALDKILQRLDMLQATNEILRLKIDSQNLILDQQITRQQKEFKKSLDQLQNEFIEGFEDSTSEKPKQTNLTDIRGNFTNEHQKINQSITTTQSSPPNCVVALEKSDQSGIHKIETPNSELEPFSVYCQLKNEFKSGLDQLQNEFKKDMDQRFIQKRNESRNNLDQQFTKQRNEFKKDMDQKFTQQQKEFKEYLDQQYTKQRNEFKKWFEDLKLAVLPTNCVQALENSGLSGVYKIKIPNSELDPFDVYCLSHVGSELEKHTRAVKSSNAAWMIIQRRQDGSVDFYRNWTEYQHGFGGLKSEFFIGLEKLHELTQSTAHELWVQMEDFEGSKRWARYSSFAIGGNNDGYILNNLGAYTGDAGDSLIQHVGKKWTTKDVNNNYKAGKANCAITYTGAWWYHRCYNSNLNGEYLHGPIPNDKYGKGITWDGFRGTDYSLKYVHMAIRPVQ